MDASKAQAALQELRTQQEERTAASHRARATADALSQKMTEIEAELAEMGVSSVEEAEAKVEELNREAASLMSKARKKLAKTQ